MSNAADRSRPISTMTSLLSAVKNLVQVSGTRNLHRIELRSIRFKFQVPEKYLRKKARLTLLKLAQVSGISFWCHILE